MCPGRLVEPEASRLLARAERPDLRGRVSLSRIRQQGGLASPYARASAVVVPSLWERGGDAMLETLSSGGPGSLRRLGDLCWPSSRKAGPTRLSSTARDTGCPRWGLLRQLLREREHDARLSFWGPPGGARVAGHRWRRRAGLGAGGRARADASIGGETLLTKGAR